MAQRRSSIEVDFLTRTLVRLEESLAENARASRALSESHERLQASEQQHRELFERTPLPMLAYDRDTLEIVAVSHAAVAAYGYSREEFLTMTINDILPPEDVPSFLGYLDSVRGPARLGSSPLQRWRHQCSDGRIVDVEVNSDDLTLDGRDCRVALCQDVTARNRTAAELARARAEEDERAALRARLLSNLSHEICTPMNAVVGMNEALLATALTSEQRECAEHVSNAARQMLAVIHDLLDIAEIETGYVTLDDSEFDPHETVEQACAIVRLEALAKRLELDVEIDPEVPRRVRGDARRLRKVILQLLSNAVKFTAEGGIAVRVSAQQKAPSQAIVRIEVTDSGIGIDPAVIESMFGAFVQADSSTTRVHGGAGLGLAIARAFTELMGGSIGSESQPGVGSSFWLEVPFEQPDSQLVEPYGKLVPIRSRRRPGQSSVRAKRAPAVA